MLWHVLRHLSGWVITWLWIHQSFQLEQTHGWKRCSLFQSDSYQHLNMAPICQPQKWSSGKKEPKYSPNYQPNNHSKWHYSSVGHNPTHRCVKVALSSRQRSYCCWHRMFLSSSLCSSTDSRLIAGGQLPADHIPVRLGAGNRLPRSVWQPAWGLKFSSVPEIL